MTSWPRVLDTEIDDVQNHVSRVARRTPALPLL